MMPGVIRIQGHVDGAKFKDRENCLEDVKARRQANADDIALFNTHLPQSGGYASALDLQLPVG
jgi:hypothetical protein